jgi:predicted pyridoxine 5'-phosphate oxidase superfamily flavin-nucleotide-binding protein
MRMDTFGRLMFDGPVRAEQEKRGSAATYARMADRPGPDALSPDEIAFIESRDSFYLGTVSSSGWPYVQHRGGPAGFLRVIGPTTLAMADYRGNRQFVSTGHIAADGRVSLFLMDYPRRARLKILGHARIVEASADPALAARLTADGAPPAERLMTVEVAAFDWNCPKYITPRFTEAEITALLGPRLVALEEENRALKARLAELDPGT